jgi:hypothetical protein
MEDIAMIDLWKSYDKKLEETLAFNRRNADAITHIKAGSFLASMKPIKVFTIVVGILWVAFIDIIIIGSFPAASPFFWVSLGIQSLLTKVAIGVYLYQLALIHQVDISGPILVTQQKIARLQSSTLWITRLLFLQTPIWTTFFWSKQLFATGNIFLLVLPVVIALLFTWAAIWLFINIRYKNKDKKWFRLIFRGREWDPMLKAQDMLEQIGEYREDLSTK